MLGYPATMPGASTSIGQSGRTGFAKLRAALIAIPLFAVTIVACAVLTNAGGWMLAIIVSVIAGLGLVVLMRDSFFLGFSGLLLCAIAGIGASSIETPLFGSTVRGICIDQAADYPAASVFYFTGGRVLTQADWDLPVYGGSKGINHELYRLSIAPIVEDGWTSDQPITAWAVSSGPNSSLTRSDWSRPSRAGVRVVSSSNDDIRKAIARAEQAYHLTSVKDVVLLHWLDDPAAAVSAQYWKLLTIFCVCVGIWAILVVGSQLLARRR
jgi:hypothetical protein